MHVVLKTVSSAGAHTSNTGSKMARALRTSAFARAAMRHRRPHLARAASHGGLPYVRTVCKPQESRLFVPSRGPPPMLWHLLVPTAPHTHTHRSFKDFTHHWQVYAPDTKKRPNKKAPGREKTETAPRKNSLGPTFRWQDGRKGLQREGGLSGEGRLRPVGNCLLGGGARMVRRKVPGGRRGRSQRAAARALLLRSGHR